MEKKEKLIIADNVCMCSGVCCPERENCHRFRLCTFYDVIAKRPHPNPLFVDPAWDEKKQSCHFFVKVKYRT